MRTAIICGALMALASTAAAFAQAKYTIYHGSAARECSVINEIYRRGTYDPFNAESIERADNDLYAWIGGYLTGVSEAWAELRGRAMTKDVDIEVIAAKVKAYCRRHPTERVGVAVSIAAADDLK
jgi:hypothetical protein